MNLSEEKQRAFKDQLKKIENKLEGFSSMMNAPGFDSPVSIEAYIISDNGTDSMIRRAFQNAFCRKAAENLLSVNELSVAQAFETYPYPLFVVSDDSELDRETSNRLKRRAASGYLTFPLILFSDRFFQPVFGECIAYLPIIESMEQAASCKSAAFRISDLEQQNDLICRYLQKVGNLVRMEQIHHFCSDVQAYLQTQISDYDDCLHEQELSAAARLVLLTKLHSRCALRKELSDLLAEAQKLAVLCNAVISDMRDIYDCHINEIINKAVPGQQSPDAVRLDLKYEQKNGYIKSFLADTEAKLMQYQAYLPELPDKLQKHKGILSDQAAHISLIGTFSSGKTTLINSFLFLPKNRAFRTSSKHNTAVLMEINYAESPGKETCEMVYQKTLRWTLIKPASYESTSQTRNEEKSDIRITDIGEDHTNYIISYTVLDGSKRNGIAKPRKDGVKLAVKKGSILKREESFVKCNSVSEENRTIILASKGEITLLYSCIKKGWLKQCVLSISEK